MPKERRHRPGWARTTFIRSAEATTNVTASSQSHIYIYIIVVVAVVAVVAVVVLLLWVAGFYRSLRG